MHATSDRLLCPNSLLSAPRPLCVVLKRYGESDQRVFEIPCPECGARETLRVWIEEDVDKWRTQGTLRYPPTWRIRSLAASRRSTPYS
jgi:hypothetical protein